MQRALAAAVVLVVLLPGCAAPEPEELPVLEGEPVPRQLPVLEMKVEARGNTTFQFGEVLGSPAGTVVSPYRYDDDTKALVAAVPRGTTHLVVVHDPDPTNRPTLVANATRALAYPTHDPDYPTILEFEPDRDGFEMEVVQAGTCHAKVNNRGNITEGRGPFSLARFAPGDWTVVQFTGNASYCPSLRFEARAVGLWTVVAPPSD